MRAPAWRFRALLQEILHPPSTLEIMAKDFGFFTTEPYIPSVYVSVGDTPAENFVRTKNGGPAVAGHHRPRFKIDPDAAVTTGVKVTALALLDVLPAK